MTKEKEKEEERKKEEEERERREEGKPKRIQQFSKIRSAPWHYKTVRSSGSDAAVSGALCQWIVQGPHRLCILLMLFLLLFLLILLLAPLSPAKRQIRLSALRSCEFHVAAATAKTS